MTYLIECKNIQNNHLLVYYKFEEFGIDVDDVDDSDQTENVRPSYLTADKWLTLKNWIFINGQLNQIIKKYKTKKKKYEIDIPNTDFKLSVKWSKINSNMGEILKSLAAIETEITTFTNHFLEIIVFSSETSELQKFAQELQKKNKHLKQPATSLSPQLVGDNSDKQNASPNLNKQDNECKVVIEKRIATSPTAINTATVTDDDNIEEYIPNNRKLNDTSAIKDEIIYEPGNVEHKHSQLEYNPTATRPIGDDTMKFFQYSPSPSNRNQQNEYIPLDKTPPNQMIKTRPLYTPTNTMQSTSIQINSSADSSQKKHNTQVTAVKAKRSRSKDLFGSDTDSVVEQNTQKKKILTKKKELTSSKKLHQPREYLSRESKKDICLKDADANIENENIDEVHHVKTKKTKKAKTTKATSNNDHSKSMMLGWLSKPNKDKLSESPNTPSRKATETYTEEDHKKFKEDMDRKMEELQNIKKACDKLSIKLPDVKPLNLNHLSVEEVQESYKIFEKMLYSIYKKYYTIQTNKLPQSNVMTSFTQNYLLKETQQLGMMEVLDDKFGIEAVDLCWKQIMPEWTLALFMHTHNISTKEESIKRLDLQEKVIIASKSVNDDFLSISQI